jgi:hypothetical protein
MSPVVFVGFGAIDAALISQAVYAIRDLRRHDEPDAKPKAPIQRAPRRFD